MAGYTVLDALRKNFLQKKKKENEERLAKKKQTEMENMFSKYIYQNSKTVVRKPAPNKKRSSNPFATAVKPQKRVTQKTPKKTSMSIEEHQYLLAKGKFEAAIDVLDTIIDVKSEQLTLDSLDYLEKYKQNLKEGLNQLTLTLKNSQKKNQTT